ncbi:MAG TPA: hypothetical protein VFM69_01815, partial [Pricia sp.]|nr:hypothetical protein [Pricia sp.]
FYDVQFVYHDVIRLCLRIYDKIVHLWIFQNLIRLLFRLKTYRLVLYFYRPLLWISIAVTCIQYALLNSLEINGVFPKIVLAKLFLFGFLFLFYLDARLDRKLTFYKNFGISKLGLFAYSFLIDTLLTIVTIFILKLI